jgi:hypothetical protein
MTEGFTRSEDELFAANDVDEYVEVNKNKASIMSSRRIKVSNV